MMCWISIDVDFTKLGDWPKFNQVSQTRDDDDVNQNG